MGVFIKLQSCITCVCEREDEVDSNMAALGPIVWAIERDLIDDGVTTYWLSDNSCAIKAMTCEDKQLDASFFEQKVLKGVLLSIKHSSSSKNAQKVWVKSSFYSNSNDSKRAKVSMAANYDRMLVFGDLLNPPFCFAIFCQTTTAAYNYLTDCKETIGIGRVYYVVEPERSHKEMSTNFPIIASTNAIVPLKFSTVNHPITTTMTACQAEVPKETGDQLFFVNHNSRITLSRFELIMKGVSCSGLFCDRAQELEKNVHCGCLYAGESNASVGQFTVTFDVPATIDQSGKAEVSKVRSLRTTRLFFDNLSTFSGQTSENIKKRFIEIRPKIRAMVQYINDNDGWTIVGWFKQGEVYDASGTEKIESSTLVLHISLLIPTKQDIANGNDQAFNNLKIRTENDLQGVSVASAGSVAF